MNRFYMLLLGVLACYVLLASSPTSATANILGYSETYVANGTNFGTDVEGLAGATFTLKFTTNSSVYTNFFGAFPSAPATSATMTISGSTNPANNGTFVSTASVELLPNANLGFGPQSIVIDSTGFDPSFVLPSGNVLFNARNAYSTASSPAVGASALVSDFVSGPASQLFGPAVAPSGGGANLWGGTLSSGARTIVPEPCSLLLLGLAGLGMVSRRGRK